MRTSRRKSLVKLKNKGLPTAILGKGTAMRQRLTAFGPYVVFFAAALIMVFMAACGGGGTTMTGPTSTPVPTATPTAAPLSCSTLKARRAERALALSRMIPHLGVPVRPLRVGSGPARRVCPPKGPGFMHCESWIRTDIHSAFTPGGYGPADLQGWYNLAAFSSANGASQTIAIVDAQDDPNAEADLGIYRSQFALPPCTTANGCFMKVNQSGFTSPLPTPDSGWAGEISLDLDMASAICPNCEIVLVEANSEGNTDFYTAEDTAATTCGATVISNSWDGGEYNTEAADEVHFNHPGVMITFASGDNGYNSGIDGYPVGSQYVTGVGGTTLCTALLPGPCVSVGETVWNGGGSDCSQFIAQPAWQAALPAITAVCSNRVTADVAAVADINTPVAVYDTYQSPGWVAYGGTSVATPIIAGVYAIAENGSTIGYGYSYAHTGSLNDITVGNNGTCIGMLLLCNAEVGYDGPTGNGTPHGIGGF
jgi:hypothetical protein